MAVTLDAATLAKRIQGAAEDKPEVAASLLAIATAHVLDYSPGAPDALHDEAVVRFAGYISQSDFGSLVKEGIGSRDVEFVVNHSGAFRNSGAAMLLSPWRIRTAALVGE